MGRGGGTDSSSDFVFSVAHFFCCPHTLSEAGLRQELAEAQQRLQDVEQQHALTVANLKQGFVA